MAFGEHGDCLLGERAACRGLAHPRERQREARAPDGAEPRQRHRVAGAEDLREQLDGPRPLPGVEQHEALVERDRRRVAHVAGPLEGSPRLTEFVE